MSANNTPNKAFLYRQQLMQNMFADPIGVQQLFEHDSARQNLPAGSQEPDYPEVPTLPFEFPPEDRSPSKKSKKSKKETNKKVIIDLTSSDTTESEEEEEKKKQPLSPYEFHPSAYIPGSFPPKPEEERKRKSHSDQFFTAPATPMTIARPTEGWNLPPELKTPKAKLAPGYMDPFDFSSFKP